jgi:hypothetical protein
VTSPLFAAYRLIRAADRQLGPVNFGCDGRKQRLRLPMPSCEEIRRFRIPILSSSRRTPGIWTKLFYGFGSVAFGVKDNGFGLFLLLYYNQVLGLPEEWVGFGIMIALFADAVFDPIVGYLSDHLHSPWGRRHPFMYASAVPVAAAYYFLWNPPDDMSQGELFAYLVAMSILVRILIACYEIQRFARLWADRQLRRPHVDPQLQIPLRLVRRPDCRVSRVSAVSGRRCATSSRCPEPERI